MSIVINNGVPVAGGGGGGGGGGIFAGDEAQSGTFAYGAFSSLLLTTLFFTSAFTNPPHTILAINIDTQGLGVIVSVFGGSVTTTDVDITLGSFHGSSGGDSVYWLAIATP